VLPTGTVGNALSIYTRRKPFGALQLDKMRRFKQLKQEITRLKKLVAERNLAIEVMRRSQKMASVPIRYKQVA
jgi:hypothetical protein